MATGDETDSNPRIKGDVQNSSNNPGSFRPAETESFDNYGISYRRGNSRLLYIVGISILALAGLILVYFVFLK